MKKSVVGGGLQAVPEAQAAQAMWDYYKNNKALLVPDIREYRDYILGELMQGKSASDVFSQFTRSVVSSVGSKSACQR